MKNHVADASLHEKSAAEHAVRQGSFHSYPAVHVNIARPSCFPPLPWLVVFTPLRRDRDGFYRWGGCICWVLQFSSQIVPFRKDDIEGRIERRFFLQGLCVCDRPVLLLLNWFAEVCFIE